MIMVRGGKLLSRSRLAESLLQEQLDVEGALTNNFYLKVNVYDE